MNFLISRIQELALNNDGTFNDDTSGGKVASFVPAQWLNNLGQELINLISSVGLTPDASETNQVAQAVSIAAPWSQITFHYVDVNAPDPVPGWILCNGQNGTPDLRSRFIVCASSIYQVGDSGSTATKSVTINQSTLSEAQMPPHNHTIQGQLLRSSTGDSEGSSGRYNRTGTDSDSILDAGGGESHGHTGSVNVTPPYFCLAPFMRADYAQHLVTEGGI